MPDRFSKALCLTVGILCFCCSSKADEKPLTPRVPPVKLDISFIADAAAPTLSFTVTNIGETPIHRGELMLNTNGIYAFRDDGVGFGDYTIADYFGPHKEVPMIKPGGNANWEIPVEQLFDRLKAERAGTYHLYWQFFTSDEPARSKPVTLIRKADKPDADAIVPERIGSLHSPKAAARTFYAALGGNMADIQHAVRVDTKDRGQTETYHALIEQALGADLSRPQPPTNSALNPSAIGNQMAWIKSWATSMKQRSCFPTISITQK